MENEINPHMPQYIVEAPWYLNQNEININEKIPNDNLKNISPGLSFWEKSNDMNISSIKNKSEIINSKYLNNIRSAFPDLTYWDDENFENNYLVNSNNSLYNKDFE